MPTPRIFLRICRAALLTFVLALAVGPAPAQALKATVAEPACEHPCTRVAECPKVTCECAEASASGVAACDTETTHCCVTPAIACERFCEVNNQTWSGRFTTEGAAPDAATTAPPAARGASAPSPADGAASAPSPACSEPCQKAADCRTMTCQCAHGTAADVAACSPETRCCGSARVVCPHFCKGKKGKWTGKLVDATPPTATGGLLELPDLGVHDADDDGLER